MIESGLKASDLMIDFVDVTPDKSIQDTLNLMFDRNISSVLVIEDKKLVGVATLRDFVLRTPWGIKPLDKVEIREIMTKEVLIVHPEDELKKVVDLIYHRDIRIVPVVGGGLVKGIITRNEFINLFGKRIGYRYRVYDLMTCRYTTVTIHDTMEKVMNHITFYGDKYIIVLEGKKVRGVITLTDILKHLYKTNESNCRHPVEEVMTKKPITAKKDDKCDIIAETIIKNHVSALPVAENELEGVINFKCFLKVLEV